MSVIVGFQHISAGGNMHRRTFFRNAVSAAGLPFIMAFAACPATAADDSGGVSELIAPGAKIVKIASGFTWAEGPAETADGAIYFTDNREDKVHVIRPDGRVELFLGPGEAWKANGMFACPDGCLVVCTGAPNALVEIGLNGGKNILADSVDGQPFNAPNDCWVAPDGGIYFTDPYWGREEGRSRIRHLSPDGTKVRNVASDMVRPNGVVGSPDGRTLYVSDWNEKVTYAYDIGRDRGLSGRRLFAPEGDDGMTVDVAGNVYLTGKVVSIYRPDGSRIGEIEVPETPANVIFAGKDKKTLIITARTSVYSLKMR